MKPQLRKTTPTYSRCSVCRKRRYHCLRIKGKVYCRIHVPDKITSFGKIKYETINLHTE